MIAGRGIVHSERTGSPLREAGHALHGLQLWLALPAELEENEPEFLHYDADALPTCIIGDVPVRVMIGSAYGVNPIVAKISSVGAGLPAIKKGNAYLFAGKPAPTGWCENFTVG